MVILNFKCFIFSILSYIHLSGQNDSLFLSLLSNHIGRPLPASFFVIQATTGLTTYSNAPQILSNLKDIKNKQLSPYVVFLWKDELPVGARHLSSYFEKNYYLKPDEHTFIVVSDTLYDMLYRPGYDVHLYYFHEGRRLFSANGKYEGIPDTLLPYTLMHLGPVEEYVFEDTVHRHDYLEVFCPISDTLALSVAEDHFAPVRLVRLVDGRVFNVFRPPSKHVKEWLFRYQNSKGYSYEEISRGVDMMDTVRRSSFKPYVAMLKDSSALFLAGDLNLFIPSRDKRIFTPTPFPSEPTTESCENDIVQEANDFIFRFNPKNLHLEKMYFIDNHQESRFFKTHFLETPNGFYFHNDTFYIYGYKHNERKDKTYDIFFRRNKNVRFVHVFAADGETLRFVSSAKPRFQRNFGMVYHSGPFYYFFKTPEGIFVFNQYFPEIYHLNKKKPVKFWVKNPGELKYRFPDFYDTTASVVPFFTRRPFFLADFKVMALLTIRNKKDVYLQLYLPNFFLIQEIHLNKYLPEHVTKEIYYLEDGQYFITNNYICFIVCQKNGCKLYRLKYILNPVNTGSLPWQNYFEK